MMIAPGGSPAQNMEVDSEYNGDPTPEQIMDIDATETGREIRRRIAEQVHAVRRVMRPNDPLICELLVPRDLAESTFKLPAVEKILHEFLPLEEAVNDLLSPQINWAPPGYKPSDKPVRRAMARLWAIRTDGDGDCLLHSVALSLWGLHDRTLVLRSLVVEVLQDRPSEKTLFKIWREGQLRADAAAGENASFEMEEDQVVAEWHMLVEAANTPSAYLSSFHAFVLANALRRPILVYGDRFVRGRDGEPYAPSDVRGVYLPTLLDPGACYKLPIAVGYTCVAVGKVGHFTALVGVDRELRHLPLVDEHGENLPIRYGLPQATVANPDPEGDAMDDYMATTTFYTEERVEHRMATVRGAYMTPEADGIRRTMALVAEAAFDRLAKAQEEEIKRASQASNEGGNLPPSTGDSLPPPPPPIPPPPPLAAAAANNDGALPPPASVTARPSGAPFDDKAAEASKRKDSGATPQEGGGSSGGRSAEDPEGGAGQTSNGFGSAGASAAAEGERGPGRSGSGGDGSTAALEGDGRDKPSDALPKSGSSSNGGAGSRSDSAASSTAATRTTPTGAADTNGPSGESSAPATATPPVGSRFLSAPLGVLSAVGAWATGRGRSSFGSAASGADPSADAAGAAAAETVSAGDRLECDQADRAAVAGDGRGSTQGNSTLGAGTAAGEPPRLPGEGGGSGGRADARPPALKLDDSARDVPGQGDGNAVDHQSKVSTSGRRPPDAMVPGSGMDLESPPPRGRSAEGAEGDTAVASGKRKPVSSPAVTPDGPNPGQHFGGTDGNVRASGDAPAHGEDDWRVGDSSAPTAAGSRRSKGRSTSSLPRGRATAAAGAEANGDAAVLGGGGTATSRNGGTSALGDRDFAAVAEAYHATERWRAASRSVGTRRGQPHPRGNHDHPASTRGGRGGNPWLERAPAAVPSQQRARAPGEERFDSDAATGQRYSTGGSMKSGGGTTGFDTASTQLSEDEPPVFSDIDGGGSSRRGTSRTRADSKPRANGGGHEVEVSAATARYHSRTRLRPEGGRGGGVMAGNEDGNPYRVSDSGGRVVRDGMDTMSLSNGHAEGDRLGYSDRAVNGTADGEGSGGAGRGGARRGGGERGQGDESYRHDRDTQYLRRTGSLSTSSRRSASPAAAAAVRAKEPPFSQPEPPNYGLHPRAPPPPTSVDSGHGRRVTRSTSSPSRGAGMLARSSSNGSLGRGAVDGEWSAVGNGQGDRVSRGGSTRAAAGRTSLYGGGNGTYGSYATRGAVGSTAATAYHRRDADWREREREALATSRLLSSSSSHGTRKASSSTTTTRGGGRSSSPSPRPASASSSWKSDSLRRALEQPLTPSGRSRSPWTTASSSSAGSSASYLASTLGAAAGRGAVAPPSTSSLNVPAAVARELTARGGRLAGTAGSGGGSRSSRNSVRSSGSSGIGPGPAASAAAFDGQTLSSLRRSRVAQERRAMEAGAAGVREGIHADVGASRPRTPYTPKFY
ncbi:unnamed protein product [Scytosiphon promiscuus]